MSLRTGASGSEFLDLPVDQLIRGGGVDGRAARGVGDGDRGAVIGELGDGEPTKAGGPAEVTCTGAAHRTAGCDVPGEHRPAPTCGYVYRLRSTAARTGGTDGGRSR